MVAVMIDRVGVENFFKKIVVKTYKLMSGLYPNFRDTILISGKKPSDWHLTEASIREFEKYYPHIKKYNLDNVPGEVLIDIVDREDK